MTVTTDTIKKGSSHAQFVKTANDQGWVVTANEGSWHGSIVVKATDPTYDGSQVQAYKDTTTAVVVTFDDDGRFLSGHVVAATKYSDSVTEVTVRNRNLSKWSEAKGHVALGPVHRAEVKAKAEAATKAYEEKTAAAKVLLDAAATTDEIKSVKSQTAHDLGYSERNLKENLNAVISEAQAALEQIEAGHKTGRSFNQLFGHSLDKAIEEHGKRNGLLDMKWHLARLFGEDGLDTQW